MSIKINQEKCIGCGRCTEICPEVFKLNENGKAEVKNEKDTECAMKAVNECPQEVISVSE